MSYKYFPLLAVCLVLLSCNEADITDTSFRNIDFQTLSNADGKDGNWLLHGMNYDETRHSPLTQINIENINDLGLDWSLPIGQKRGIESTPLVVDGIMYLTGPWSVVYAVDLRTKTFLWKFDPEVDKSYGEKGCCDVVNRGLALYEDKIFVGAFDGRLIALNRKTGEKLWEKVTVDQSKPYTITGAPRVIKDKVFIGNGGAEFGVRGYFAAYDVNTGEELWRFYTVPGNPEDGFENEAMEAAADTWTGHWWEFGGGGTVWDNMAYDPELNLMYVGTGNGSPWDRSKRSPDGGDNLYLSSILAINPDTGELVWHYQTTPGDSWDFTATQHIILAELEIKGKKRKVLMQAPKNGFFYVIDRETGELLSADKFTYVTWADSVDMKTGKPVETKWARYDKANVDLAPNYDGGHNWHPMSFNPALGLVYIPSRETFSNYGQDKTWKYNEEGFGTGIGWNLAIGSDDSKPTIKDEKAEKHGTLIAWDPVMKKARWSNVQGNFWNGGLLSTASNLLFQGTADGRITAYNGETGELIWEKNLQTGIMAPPVTYQVDGKQYVTVITGWGGGYGMKNKHTNQVLPGTIYTFTLGGTEALPEEVPPLEKKLVNLEWELDEEAVAHGQMVFDQYCGPCHVINSGGGGVAPDLGYSPLVGTEGFGQVVLEGAFLMNGMPKFEGRLNEDDVSDIEQFIVKVVRE